MKGTADDVSVQDIYVHGLKYSIIVNYHFSLNVKSSQFHSNSQSSSVERQRIRDNPSSTEKKRCKNWETHTTRVQGLLQTYNDQDHVISGKINTKINETGKSPERSITNAAAHTSQTCTSNSVTLK